MPGIIIHPLRAVYWAVPKVASTSMKLHIAKVCGIAPAAIVHDSQFEYCEHLIPDYYNFALVRNPYARLYSLFIDKIKADGRNDNEHELGIQRIVFGRWKDRLHCGMSFSEFIDFIVSIPYAECDPHFAPQVTCVPGGVAIYKAEDVHIFMQLFLPKENVSQYAKPWTAVYTDEMKWKVYRFYHSDFLRFNYSF